MRANHLALLTVIFLHLFIGVSFGQQVYKPSEKHLRNTHALENWRELKDGILVFVLVTNEKKLKHIDKVLSSDKLTNGQRKYYNIEKKAASSEVKRYDVDLKEALKNFYEFSDYAFVKDIDMRNYLENKESLKIYNAAGNLVEHDESEKLFFFRASNAGIGNYVIYDDELNSIARPFPGSYRRTIFTSLRSFPSVIEQLNERLHKFARKKFIYHE